MRNQIDFLIEWILYMPFFKISIHLFTLFTLAIMFVHLIEQLKVRLQQPLPGQAAQFLMAPLERERITPDFTKKIVPQKSAVLILLFPSKQNIYTLLIQRSKYNGVHSAQVAFPGGKIEKGDIDLKQTALRETQEEIGINTSQIDILGKLTDIYITPSNYIVSPYIGYSEQLSDFDIDTREVEKVIITDLIQLNNPNIKSVKLITHSAGDKIKTPYYEIEGLTVWGATAMIISELNAVIKESKNIIL